MFRKVVEKANEWLAKNKDVKVKTCETMTWMSHDPKQLGETEQMVLSKQLAEGTNTYFARGLRYGIVVIEVMSGGAVAVDVFGKALPAIEVSTGVKVAGRALSLSKSSVRRFSRNLTRVKMSVLVMNARK